ncbi:nucleotidyl transferase AbiEii/AbiGii toxin family protein [Maridesulfovibrio ferrireducens]|uniref:nucleotidyl transferase AbiEii/AbiGii toxin family protein n=1 Tax=Maridesulfovibrio ferrireducens TaxID=246191 RepID=UPI001A1F3456|nr:nucleotidyl transferase AbiEii/AbiGii toxin family protein [Maridesulfovibrio ferrireducens]MBI9109565.1 nucleotidyl transferase AbiEii/AbiGii toxin family protein [Maridesulfovibrio ferrireducens]
MNKYEKQVRILLRVLALIEFDHPNGDGSPFLALKGGTALNFFLWDLPRLSVDIDLAYCPINDRPTALQDISDSMQRLAKRVEELLPTASVNLTAPKNAAPKVLINYDGVMVKIEPNATIRGTVYETEYVGLQPEVERRFEMAVEVRRLSIHDLYGGKICAALDRQHPRDLFDVAQLLDTEGLSEKTRKAFIVYLLGHNRPMSELLNPNFQPLAEPYEKEFRGMTRTEVSVEKLEATRIQLVHEIKSGLSEKDKRFLLSVKQGSPKWSLLGIPHAEQLPAVRWKLHNIEQLRKNSVKHAEAVRKLKECFEI